MSQAGVITTGTRGRLASRIRTRARSVGVLGVAVAAGVVAGALAAQGQIEVAFAVAAGVLGWAALRYVSVVTWVVLLLVTAVATRGLVTALGLPQAFDFAHYPLVAGSAIGALHQPARHASRAPAIWILGLVALSGISAVANLTHPLRIALFLMIVGEPLVIVWVLCRYRIGDRARRVIGIAAVVLAAVQVPIASMQMIRYSWGDPVQGSLAGHGAGAHVLGALFALGLLITTAAVSARVLTIRTALLLGCVSLAMMLMTGSMAITVLTAVVIPFIPLLARGGPPGSRSAGRALMAAAVAIGLAAVALSVAEVLVSNIYERAERLIVREEFPEVRMVVERSDDPGLLMFGSGPGTSGSRASILLIGADEQGSPLASLQLDPTDEAIEIATSTRAAGGGTAESARSSALALIGDLGVFGFLALAALFVSIWRRSARSHDWLAAAVRGVLLLLAALIFVDSWLEYPEFAVPLAVLIGLVLTGTPSGEGVGGSEIVRRPIGILTGDPLRTADAAV